MQLSDESTSGEKSAEKAVGALQRPSRLVLNERAHVVACEPFPAGEEFEFDDKGEADDLAAEAFD